MHESWFFTKRDVFPQDPKLREAYVDRVLFSLEKQEAKFWSRQGFLWHCNECVLHLTFLWSKTPSHSLKTLLSRMLTIPRKALTWMLWVPTDPSRGWLSLMFWRRVTVSHRNSFRSMLRVLTLVLMNYELFSEYRSFYTLMKWREQLPFSTLQNGIFRIDAYPTSPP